MQQSTFDIRYYGASIKATALNNTAAILECINEVNASGGGTIYIPKGDFKVTKNPGIAVWNLSNIHNINFVGEGEDSKLLLEAGSYAGDTHFFSFTGCTNISFRNILFDGNRGNHTVDNEQMHGIRMFDCSFFTVDNCTFKNTRGDGIFLLGNSSNSKIWINKCRFLNNGRSGITIQRLNNYVSITDNYFEETNDQAIDSEPTGGFGYTNVNIEGNFFHWSVARNIGVTLGGSGSQGVNFINNRMPNAGVFATSLKDSKVAMNTIGNTLAILEASSDVEIINNTITSTGKAINVYYQNGQPKNFTITGNKCSTSSTTENIISAQVDGLDISNNICRATAPTGTTGAGIVISAPTITGSNYEALKVNGNEVYNCNIGIVAGASNSKKWKSGSFTLNTIKDLRSVKTITTGINLSGQAYYFFEDLFIDKNAFDSNLTESNQVVLNASGVSWYKIDHNKYSGLVLPEGIVSAQYNTTYSLIGLPLVYLKTSDGGNTGWQEQNTKLPLVIFNDELLSAPQANITAHTPDFNLPSASWTNVSGQHDCLPTGEASAITLAASKAIATINSGLSDCVIQSLVRTGTAGQEYAGLAFRVLDGDNYLAFEISAGLDLIRLIRVSANTTTVLASKSVPIPATGHQVLRVTMSGDLIVCEYNGGNQLTVQETFNQALTNHGFVSRVATRYYFKDFKISK